MRFTLPRLFNIIVTISLSCVCLHAQVHQYCGAEVLPKNASEKMQNQQVKFEKAYQKFIKSESFQARSTKYTLPVVFHVIHNGGVENISDAQVLAGLNHLNTAFQNIGYYDDQVGEDVEVQFCLAKRDPDDKATTGINHIQHSLTNLNKDNQDLALKNLIRWNPTSYINIWLVDEICSANGCGVVGYAYFPSAHGSNVDGIVMEGSYLGTSPANTSVLVHEMGHYLGLYHTFQGGCTNTNCLSDGDRVCDTPPDQSTARVPCNSNTNSCTTDVNSSDSNNPFTSDQNDMFNNYMDYSNLECYSAFTLGQKDRIHFAIENQRTSLLDSKACLDPCLDPIIASIIVANTNINIGETVNFSNNTTGATSYEWLIDGTPFSNSISPSYLFNEEGIFTISLIANSSDPNCENITTIEIHVVCPVVASFVSSGSDVKPGTEVFFSNISQNATSYQWLLNGLPISTNYNYSSIFTIDGTYDIQLIAKNGLCSDTSSIKIITVSDFGIAGTGLPIWPVKARGSDIIETVDWQNENPEVNIITNDGQDAGGQTGVGINACGELSFYVVQPGSSESNNLNIYLPDGTEILSQNTSNGPGLNGVRGNNEIQVVRVPTFSNEWYIIYSEWSTDIGATANNAGYTPANLLYSRVRLDDHDNLVVKQRDITLIAGGTDYTYADGKAVSRTAYGDRDQHFLYACRRAIGVNTASVDRFLITDKSITWEVNTGNVNVPWWNLTIAGSPIELSPTEDRIAVSCRNQDTNRPDVLIFNSNTFTASDHLSLSSGELVLVSDGTSNDMSSELPYSGRVKDIANDNSLNLKFLRNYERKLSRIEFSPNGRFLYLSSGGYTQGGYTNITYLSQVDLESNPMEVRMQIQTTPNDAYDATSGQGCPTSSSACLNAYPSIGPIQSSYDGKLYFVKRHDNKFYVIPNPNDILPQNLVPSDINLETVDSPNIVMNGITGSMPDQIDGYNYTDERFTKLEFNTNALDCNDDCLAPYDVELYLEDKLIEIFVAGSCPDTFEFCGDTTKIYSLYSPFVNLRYDSAIVFGQVNYPSQLTYFDFSDLSGCMEICDNDLDDDNDGLIDCDDPDLQDSCCCYIPPILDLGPDIEICANGVFNLDAGDQFISYKWSDLTTESKTTVYDPGKYWVEVTDSCGQIQTDSINIIWAPITQVDLGKDISICNGESVALAVTGFVTYEWSPTDGIDCIDCETISLDPDSSITYIVVAGKDGCYSVDSINVYVGENSYEIIDTSICIGEVVKIGNVELGVGDSQLFILKNAAGCDSTLEVTVNDNGFTTYQEFIDTLICENESVVIFGKEYNAYSLDTLRYQTFSGCDSFIYINIGGVLTASTSDTISLCYGDSINVFGSLEGSEGDFINLFASANFCDSTHTITLIVQDEIMATFESTPPCHNESNGSIDLAPSGGMPPYIYEWNSTNIDTNNLENLAAGEYFVTIQDFSNCEMSTSIIIESLFDIELSVNVQDILCFGEENGVIDLSNNQDGLDYSLDNDPFTADVLFDSLAPGIYNVIAKDEFDCLYSSTVEIGDLEEYFVQLPEDTTILFGDSFIIFPNTNAAGDLTYFWPIDEGLDCNDCFTPIAMPYDDITYTLKIVDKNGCETEDEMLVKIERKKQVFIPNVFSPNGDNINDYFFPEIGLGVRSILKMDVYDRWGGLIYEDSNIDFRASAKGWDGTTNGTPVNPGVYVFIINVQYIDGITEIFSGDITVVR